MKKILLLSVLCAALVVPASGIAKSSPQPRDPKAENVTVKNAARFCAALRDANPALFRAVFGKNRTERNAFGKCVSSHVRSRHEARSLTFVLRKLSLLGSGKVTDAGVAGCQTSTTGCTLASTGSIRGLVGGTFTSTFTVMWTQATSNGHSGFCAPADGQVVVSLPQLGSLTKHEIGSLCEIGATGPNVPHRFTGTFTVVSGTGVFFGATGSGKSAFTQQPGSTSAMGGAVTGTEAFDLLTLHL